MSSTIIDNEFYSDRNLDVYEKTVLSYLIRFHNKKLGYSFPTRKQIQEDNGISTGKLNQVLQSLEDKGYITRANNPNKGGRNNIYYIHKYLVIRNDNESLSEPITDDLNDNAINSSSDKSESLTELSTKLKNEVLQEKANLKKALTKEELEKLKGMNYSILEKSINRANKQKGDEKYHFNYIVTIYEGMKEPKADVPKQNKEAQSKVKTKYHDTFNEHYKKYKEDELEKKLLKAQNKLSYASSL